MHWTSTEIVNQLNKVMLNSNFSIYKHQVTHCIRKSISNGLVYVSGNILWQCSVFNRQIWTASSTSISASIHMANSNEPQMGSTHMFNQTETFCNLQKASAQDRRTDQSQIWSRVLPPPGQGWQLVSDLFQLQSCPFCSFRILHCCC